MLELILQNFWIISSPLLYFNFKSFMDPNSSSFIRSQSILHDWRVLFSESWNFYKLKKGDLISGGKQFCRKSELFGHPCCIWYLKVLWTQIHHHLIISMNSAWLTSNFLRVLKFLQVKDGDLIFGWNQFCRKSALFGHPFSLSIKKVLRTQIFCHWLDFNAFCMIQE